MIKLSQAHVLGTIIAFLIGRYVIFLNLNNISKISLLLSKNNSFIIMIDLINKILPCNEYMSLFSFIFSKLLIIKSYIIWN